MRCQTAWRVGIAWKVDPTVESSLAFFAETDEEAREACEAREPEHAVTGVERTPWLDGASWGIDAAAILNRARAT